MQKVLVTGGAGYIGSVLIRLLLQKGYSVRVLDNLMYGGEPVIDLLNDDNFEFIHGDVRKPKDVNNSLEDIDAVVHFAAIVGDPACSKHPELAKEVNLEASKQVYQLADNIGVKKFIFASTCSNYGKMSDSNGFVDENSKLAPVSLYAETKVAFEEFLLCQLRTNICKPTSLRFSTVYGISLRPRFDLTVNEFTKELTLGRELVVFGEQFWRPYCHVVDLARSVIHILEADEDIVEYNVFNVGSTAENYTKKMLVNEMKKLIPGSKVKYVHKDEDPRDYRVSFEKIHKIGFGITKKVPDGIHQIKEAIEKGLISNPDDPKYRNV